MKDTHFDKTTKRYVSLRTGRTLCACGRGGGSDYDGKCYTCRGGVTAFEAKAKADKALK